MRQRLVLWPAVAILLAAGLLLAATASAQEGIIHVVRRGDTVGNLAWQYGVSSRAIVQANHLRNPNLIYVGQRLIIPVPGGAAPTPTPCRCEEIVIFSPTREMTITSPVTVTGLAAGFEQSIVVAVLDGSAGEIGRAYGSIVGEYGRQGPFTTSVTFTVPANTQPGRIQVWNVSPRDGAVEHLSSVPVIVQGLELDPLLGRLADALSARDYAGLRGLMADPFAWMLYHGATTVLTPTQAIAQVQQADVGPVAPRVDFSVDARKLLGARVTFAPSVVHVAYSTGWGAEGKDDAFLLIGDVAGRARWSGILYVPHRLVDYR
ncbi:MAG: LysM peptidoglycan-binding domain-containing protein [Anaerolineae bacterium]